MSITSRVVNRSGLGRPRDVKGPLLAADRLRDAIEFERIAARDAGMPVTVLEFDLRQVDARSRRSLVDELRRLGEDILLCPVQIGWIDTLRVGIVLPGVPGTTVCDMVRERRGLARSGEQVVAWTEESAEGSRCQARDGSPAAVRHLAALYARRLPFWKRLCDILIGLTCLILLSPVLVVALLAVGLTSGFPLFFTQERVGWGGKPFRMIKIRTMCRDAEARKKQLLAYNEMDGLAFKIEHDPRVTWVGRWLRRLSIDELPQLWNVVRGDMSLVGPRPLPVTDWLPTNARHCRRHDVVPGITCLWQVSGRCRISFDTWMELDLAYVETMSPQTDCLLLLRTVPAVLFSVGAA